MAITRQFTAEPTALQAFQRLGKDQSYLVDPDDPASETSFPVEVGIHYLPGNHDRLANATDRIRARVRELLGLSAQRGQFPHELRFQDPAVLIRHGHEYDRYNFSVDHRHQPPVLPGSFPAVEYDDPTLGDFTTVEVALQLAVLFRQHYDDICSDPVKAQVYQRLLEFDDVRFVVAGHTHNPAMELIGVARNSDRYSYGKKTRSD